MQSIKIPLPNLGAITPTHLKYTGAGLAIGLVGLGAGYLIARQRFTLILGGNNNRLQNEVNMLREQVRQQVGIDEYRRTQVMPKAEVLATGGSDDASLEALPSTSLDEQSSSDTGHQVEEVDDNEDDANHKEGDAENTGTTRKRIKKNKEN